MRAMHTYTILQITEPDYGCEETHRAEPTALLKLREDLRDGARVGRVQRLVGVPGRQE